MVEQILKILNKNYKFMKKIRSDTEMVEFHKNKIYSKSGVKHKNKPPKAEICFFF